MCRRRSMAGPITAIQGGRAAPASPVGGAA
jgi:hypothetical protein